MEGIPRKNKLPLDIRENNPIAESGESNVWKAQVQDSRAQERHIALKNIRREAFATDEEMQASKKFYEFLKAFPGFGKFVPETLYFKAKMTEDGPAQAFVIQNLLEGKTLDEIPNEELYRNPEVIKQLIEFARAAVHILQETRKSGSLKPDFGTAYTATKEAQREGNMFGNSRFTTNVLVSTVPDEKGQRVFFVDTGVNADERVNRARQISERHIMGRIREFNFNRWIKELENVLDSKKS